MITFFKEDLASGNAPASENPDAIVLDLNLPDGSEWTLLELLTSDGNLPPFLVLSVNDEQPCATRLLQAGARGCLMKSTPIIDVPTAIRKIPAGHLAVSDSHRPPPDPTTE